MTAGNSTPAAIYAASVNQLKHIILVFRTRIPCATTSILWHNALLYVANACLPLLPNSHKGKEYEQHQDLQQGQEREQVAAGAWEDSILQVDDKRRVWFLACIAGYQDLAPRFNLVTQIVPGLLRIAVLKQQMTAAEGRALTSQMRASIESSPRTSGQHPEQLHDGTAQPTFLGAPPMNGLPDDTGGVYHRETPIGPSFSMPPHPTDSRGGTFIVDLNTASINPSAATNDALASTFDKLAMFDNL